MKKLIGVLSAFVLSAVVMGSAFAATPTAKTKPGKGTTAAKSAPAKPKKHKKHSKKSTSSSKTMKSTSTAKPSK